LAELTGRKQAARQIHWLAEKGWKFIVDAHGCPKVARSFYEDTYGAKPEARKRRGVRIEGLARMSNGPT